VEDHTNPGGVPGDPQSELNSSGEARKAILQHILDLTRKLPLIALLRLEAASKPERATQTWPQQGEAMSAQSQTDPGRSTSTTPPILGEAHTRSMIERMNKVVFGE
jgi:hypothetical protein